MKTTETPTPSRRRSPIFWVPTAYFGMGLPFCCPQYGSRTDVQRSGSQ